MPRHIDAERLKRTFASGVRVYDGVCRLNDIFHTINNEPTADVVEVKHGEWIRGEPWADTGSVAYECSVCCERTYDAEYFDYCPKCGAKMGGENNESS